AGAVQDGELAGIAPVGLDAITWPARNQRRCDHVTGDAVSGQRALEFEATGPGFVATLHGTTSAQAFDKPQDRRNIRRHVPEPGRPLPRHQNDPHRPSPVPLAPPTRITL